MLSLTLLCTMDSTSLSTFLLTLKPLVSRLFDIKLAINVYFSFIIKEKFEFRVLTANTNTFALFDDTIESHNYVTKFV